MGVMQPHYRDQLLSLLPPGGVYQAATGSTLEGYLSALADELARVHGLGDVLLEESDPRTAALMFTDWELDYGLPDCCSGNLQDMAIRRALLIAKVRNTGLDPVPATFVALAALFGMTVTIEELQPYTVRSAVNARLYPLSVRYVWRVVSSLASLKRFTVQSYVNDPLSVWGNEQLECLINRLKPAHTFVQFIYTDTDIGLGEKLRVTADGFVRATSDGISRMVA